MFRALIVEDELFARQGLIMTTPWEAMNVEIIGAASNGKDGYDLAVRLRPDIIITDIKMPIMDGLEMIEQLSEEQDIVFIILSAFSEFSFAKRALQLGAVDYLLKPFTDESLKEAIENAKTQVERMKVLKNESKVSRDDLIGTVNRYLSKSDRSKHDNIQRVIDYIRTNYAQDLTVGSVAEYLQVSESYLSRLFRNETNYSFHEYLTVYRMKIACELLMDPSVKIYEVANAVGYKDQRYFSIVFKKYFGMSPNHFKEQH
ncbi:response regulator [Erysipelothrix sp. HDW6C]|uniref:response regulator transcription factor n=1 Tax=Erysipelothrix sp. HDW6C TaxID=2714930 RepID=UPI001408637C|nr:helix-turn-helix domain-containing protein [Erysipelothrix sp. HDW6C]QIK70498.1 response regulator [Erysipelothrix sp. HDW6C]